MTGWIWIAALVAILAVWAVTVYNRLQRLRNLVANAWGQIDVQLKRRYDLIPNLVEVAKGYLAHEAATLEAVTQARRQAVQAAEQARSDDRRSQQALEQAEHGLSASLGRLLVVSEAYPELKADAQMQRLSEEIVNTENRIGFARQAYNDQVLAYNDQAREFPDLLLARLLGFAPLDELQATSSAQERQAPQVRF